MKRIISTSRRNDIPAFYGEWFMTRLKEGFVGVVSPSGGKKYVVSLKPEDVLCFVFWSKNFTPLTDHLRAIEDLGYRFYFNYMVTALQEKGLLPNSNCAFHYAFLLVLYLKGSVSNAKTGALRTVTILSGLRGLDFQLVRSEGHRRRTC
jgi:hypothetical protein